MSQEIADQKTAQESCESDHRKRYAIARNRVERKKYAGKDQSGAKVFLQVKEQERDTHSHQDRYRVFQRRNFDSRQFHQPESFLTQFPQQRPALGKISGKKENE